MYKSGQVRFITEHKRKRKTGSMKIIEAFKQPSEGNPPVWFMRQAGRYLEEYRQVRSQAGDFLSLCYAPDLASEVTLQPIRRFGFDAAIIFSDILVIPQALGVEVRFEKGEGPKLAALRDAQALMALSPRSVTSFLEKVYEALRLTRVALDPSKALIGFADAPWTLASYMVEGGGSRDFDHARKLAVAEPKAFSHVIDILSNAVAEHLIAQVEAGANMLQIFDSWAGVLPEGEYERWCIAPIRSIIAKVKKAHPHIPIIGFPKGSGVRYAAFSRETGVDGVSVDMSVPLDWAREHIPEHVVIQGNLDPVLLAYGGEKAVAQTQKIVETMRGRKFIFNLGHGILQHTPVSQVEAVLKALRSAKAKDAA